MPRGLIWIVVCVLSLCSAELAAARDRGDAGTNTRKAYCAGNLAACMSSSQASCNKTYSDPTQLAACYKGGVTACTTTYGDCVTAAVVTGGSAVQKSGTAKAAP